MINHSNRNSSLTSVFSHLFQECSSLMQMCLNVHLFEDQIMLPVVPVFIAKHVNTFKTICCYKHKTAVFDAKLVPMLKLSFFIIRKHYL